MTTPPLPATDSGPMFGWRIIAVAGICQALGVGLIGVLQVLVTPLQQAFEVTGAQMGLGMALLLGTTGVASVVMGLVADRGPLRALMLGGVGAMVLSVWWLASASSLSELAVAAGFFGVAIGMYGNVPANVLLVNWFDRRRGQAIAYAAMMLSVGGMLTPPVMTWLVDGLGWRTALRLLALAAAAVLAPMIARWMTRRPEDVGLRPDGLREESEDLEAASGGDPPLPPPAKALLRSGNFWRLALGLGLAMCVSVGLGAFLIPHLETIGVSRQQAAFSPAILAGCSFLAKPAFGYLLDRAAPKPITAVILLIYASGWSMLASASNLSEALLASATTGIGSGGLLVVGPVLIAAAFGRDAMGRATGLQIPVGLPFILAVAPIVGYVRDTTGSFEPAFDALAALLLLALALLLSVRLETAPQSSP